MQMTAPVTLKHPQVRGGRWGLNPTATFAARFIAALLR